MTHILESLKNKYPAITEVKICSDGASSQFKQRFLFSNLHLWEEKFSFKVSWHFFATSHGKGVVDGIGGTVKRSVWRYVRSGKDQTATPFDFYRVAKERNPGINILYVSREQIEKERNMLETHWEGTLAIPNTHQVHSVWPKGKFALIVAETSDSPHFMEVPIKDKDLDETLDESSQPNQEEDISGREVFLVGDWVLVKYDGNIFPGEITKQSKEDGQQIYNVNFICPSGTKWKWPETPDHIMYFEKDVIRKIEAPVVAGNGGQFIFVTQF